jgi:hypothetical protein
MSAGFCPWMDMESKFDETKSVLESERGERRASTPSPLVSFLVVFGSVLLAWVQAGGARTELRCVRC